MGRHYKALALPIIILIGICVYLGINGFKSAVTIEAGMDSLRKLEWTLSPTDLTNNYGHIEYNQDYGVFYANFTSDNLFIDENGELHRTKRGGSNVAKSNQCKFSIGYGVVCLDHVVDITCCVFFI